MLKLALAIPYVLLVAAVASLWLAREYRKHPQHPGTVWFARFIEACAGWMSLDAASFLIVDPATQELARQLVWPVVLVAALSFFRFACAYAQQPTWWSAIRVPIAGAIAVEIALMLTNPYHLLIWRGSQWIDLGSTRIPRLEPGLAFYWLHVPIAYGLILGGVLALFAHALESQAFYVRRVLILSAALLVPLALNVLVITQLTSGLDLTPVAFVGSVVILARTTFRYQLLDVMPAARSLLLQQHRDGVIVLDSRSRVIDVNPAVGRMLGAEAEPGTPVAALLPFWGQVRDFVYAEGTGSTEVAHAGAVIEVRSLPVHDERARVIGRLVVLHDVTDRARLVRELNAYARTVAHDLKNPLSGAIGYLDLVRLDEPDLDEECNRLLGEARQTCHRMVSIITDLLRMRPAAAEARQQARDTARPV